jgi:probable F420-dependent oxidoreductase
LKFGVSIFLTDYTIGPAELAAALEERGFESLWLPEHTHIPTSRKSPWPAGGDLPQEYWHIMDPFVALTAAAAATKELRVATGVCLVIQHDPIALAKSVATLDMVSGGRFIFGVGAGWNREEMANHGTDPDRRFKLLRERIEAMKAIWTQDEAEYHGEFVDFEPIWSWPKPAQKPHPPVYVGGMGPHAIKRALAYGDGWMPIPGAISLSEGVADMKRQAAEAGREPLPVTAFGMPARPEVVRHYAEAGVDRCVFFLPPAGAEEVLPLMDRQAEIIREVSAG